eukprot:1357513-Amorphochlora_amoeboformis.AAC.1
MEVQRYVEYQGRFSSPGKRLLPGITAVLFMIAGYPFMGARQNTVHLSGGLGGLGRVQRGFVGSSGSLRISGNLWRAGGRRGRQGVR